MIKYAVSCLILSASVGNVYAGSMGDVNNTYDYNGLYAGMGTGFSTFFTKDKHSQAFSNAPAEITGTLRTTNMAVEFEGHVGYWKMISDKTYLGPKASVYYTPLETITQSSGATTQSIGLESSLITVSNLNQTFLKPIYNLDAVLGYEVAPHFLPFVEAGVSFSHVNSNDIQHNISQNMTSATATPFVNSLNTNGTKTGYNVGIGANYQVNQHWFISSELVYNYLGKYSQTNTANVPVNQGTETISSNRTYQLVSLLASVSYIIPGS